MVSLTCRRSMALSLHVDVHKPYSSIYDNREVDMNFLFVAFGGALGAVARYAITRSVLDFVKKTNSEIRYIAEDNVFKVRMIV